MKLSLYSRINHGSNP